MTPKLIEAARAALHALTCEDGEPHHCQHCDENIDGSGDVRARLRAAIEAAEKAKPVAYRVEVRWRDRRLDQTWRKYSDCVSRCAAGTVRERVVNSGDMESRIVPLYSGEPEGPR